MNRKFLLATFCLALAACGNDSDEDATENTAAEVENEVAARPAALPRTRAPVGAGVYFISPADGDEVSSPVDVEFGIVGMQVVKAGDNTPASGHHHLLIDAELPDMSLPIPASEHYVHFGDGSTATTVDLPPGTHTLQLLLGDYVHIPHDPPVKSAPITITVK